MDWSERVFGRTLDARILRFYATEPSLERARLSPALMDFHLAQSADYFGSVDLWRAGLVFRADSPSSVAAWDAADAAGARVDVSRACVRCSRELHRCERLRWSADGAKLVSTPPPPPLPRAPPPPLAKLFSAARREVDEWRTLGRCATPALSGRFRAWARVAGALASWQLGGAQRLVGPAPSSLNPLAVVCAHASQGLLLWDVDERACGERRAILTYVDPLGGTGRYPAAIRASSQRDLARALDLARLLAWEAATLPGWPGADTYVAAFTSALARSE